MKIIVAVNCRSFNAPGCPKKGGIAAQPAKEAIAPASVNAGVPDPWTQVLLDHDLAAVTRFWRPAHPHAAARSRFAARPRRTMKRTQICDVGDGIAVSYRS